MKKMKGKVALITGGANGLGRAACMRFGKEGAQVVSWDLNEEKSEATHQELLKAGYLSDYQLVNTADTAAVATAAEQLIEKYGRLDVLINNAGITRDAQIKKMTYQEWQQVIDVNLTGVFNCTSAFVNTMIGQEGGRIINTSSVVGVYGNFGQTNYAATKAGVIGMTKSWAKELGKHGITVNAVAPGFIATDMVAAMPEKVLQMMREKTPMRRLGQPEDIANAYAFLASEEASFISGTVLSVDGAVTL
ncbi:MAG TPA: 3-oxoacyl-ACP reductase FabG [Cytophagales bacterium]|nr:3-oxoacyl-ACP reductase FabG [Cytophagales bacterium]